MMNNPYQVASVQTMPLNLQLAALHERGAYFCRQIARHFAAGDTQSAHADIRQLQDLLTFLRSSLDRSTDVAMRTDQTYEFYYRMAVRWYLEEQLPDDEYDAIVKFFESWADIWKKVRG